MEYIFGLLNKKNVFVVGDALGKLPGTALIAMCVYPKK